MYALLYFKKKIYASGLVKLYQGVEDNWVEKLTGVLVLLYDEIVQSNFFKILSMDDNSVVWDQGNKRFSKKKPIKKNIFSVG